MHFYQHLLITIIFCATCTELETKQLLLVFYFRLQSVTIGYFEKHKKMAEIRSFAGFPPFPLS